MLVGCVDEREVDADEVDDEIDLRNSLTLVTIYIAVSSQRVVNFSGI